MSDEEVMAQMEKWLKTSLSGTRTLGRRLKAIASSRYMAHRLLQTVRRPLKEKGASWHLQHLLVSSNFPRLKPRTSPLPKAHLPRGAAVCTGERAHVPLHVARVHVAGCIRMHDIRWERDTRLLDACMCATEKPVFNRAASRSAIVYARYVRQCIIAPSFAALPRIFRRRRKEEIREERISSNAEILSLGSLFLW